MTRNVQRPAEAPRRRRTGGGFLALAPLLAAAVVVAIGVVWLGGREAGVGGQSPSPVPSASVLTAEATPSTTPFPTIGPSNPPTTQPSIPPSPSATPSQVADQCTLGARITAAEGAAGSRIYSIELRNTGQVACAIAPVAAVARLVDGSGRVLAQIENPDNGARIELGPGETATTDASVSNVCGAAPVPPVTIQLDFGDVGTVTAKPLDPADATVPPCNGPTQPSDMSIHPWAR